MFNQVISHSIEIWLIVVDLDDKEAMKSLREQALNQIAQKQKERNEANASLLNDNKRESIRQQMKVWLDANEGNSSVESVCLDRRRRTKSNWFDQKERTW